MQPNENYTHHSGWSTDGGAGLSDSTESRDIVSEELVEREGNGGGGGVLKHQQGLDVGRRTQVVKVFFKSKT